MTMKLTDELRRNLAENVVGQTKQISLSEDANGKTVEHVYEDFYGQCIVFRFTDKSFIHIIVEQADSIDDNAGLDLWRAPRTPESRLAAGLINQDEYDALIAKAKADEEKRDRAELERLMKKLGETK